IEPWCVQVEVLAALDPWELDCTQLSTLIFIVASHARDFIQSAFSGQIDHALDEAKVLLVCRSGAGVVARFLYHRTLSANETRKLLLEPATNVDRINLHMAECIARHGIT